MTGREERPSERMMEEEEDWVNDPARERGRRGDIDCAGMREMDEDYWE